MEYPHSATSCGGHGITTNIIQMRRKVIVVNAVLVALLFGLISFNKNVLRPRLAHMPFAGAILGCLPNFLAAFFISLAPVYPILTRKPKHGRIGVYAVSIFVFAVLAMEEVIPIWGASNQYDPLDILASGIGSMLAVLVLELIVWTRKRAG